MPTYLIERTINGKKYSKDEERFHAINFEEAQRIAKAKYGDCEVFECDPGDDVNITDDELLDMINEKNIKQKSYEN